MVLAMDYVRGTFLFKQVEEAISELKSAPETSRKSQKLASLEYLKDRLLSKIVGSAHGFAYLSLSTLERDGKLEFLDRTEADKFREVLILVEKYGLPEAFNSALTDEVAIELVEATMRDGEAWNYTKRLCANKL